MTSRKIPLPLMSSPPSDYELQFMSDLVRTYNQAMEIIRNPGEGRATFIVLTNLQTDDVALEEGSVYKDGNTLKISVLNVAAVRGASVSGSVGDVTVAT